MTLLAGQPLGENEVTRKVMAAARAFNAHKDRWGGDFRDLARFAATCGREAQLSIKEAITASGSFDPLVERILNVAFRSR